MYKRYINSIIYTQNNKGCNLRAYVPVVSASLECSMDVQSSDGKAVLLKYVTSYVAKVPRRRQDTAVVLGRSWCLPGCDIFPQEARSNSHTKAFTAPTPDQMEHKIHLKYLACANEDEHMTFLEWLREYDHEKNPPKRYGDGNTLVGLKHSPCPTRCTSFNS